MNIVIMICTCGGAKELGSGTEIYPYNPLISNGTKMSGLEKAVTYS